MHQSQWHKWKSQYSGFGRVRGAASLSCSAGEGENCHPLLGEQFVKIALVCPDRRPAYSGLNILGLNCSHENLTWLVQDAVCLCPAVLHLWLRVPPSTSRIFSGGAGQGGGQRCGRPLFSDSSRTPGFQPTTLATPSQTGPGMAMVPCTHSGVLTLLAGTESTYVKA